MFVVEWGMPDSLDQRLARAADRVREFEGITRRCEELRRRGDELARQIQARRGEAEAEGADVARLERLTLTRVLASLRGSREDRLAREQAEADAAHYRMQQAEELLAAVRREEDAAQARLGELAGAPQEYTAVLADKERYLSESGDPRGEHLMALADEKGRVSAELREVAEALQAATAADQALAAVQARLGSASSWSAYDTWFGGGAFSSAIKHDRLEQAAAAAHNADRHLAVLRTELADVDGRFPVTPQLKMDGLTRFFDIWLDNIFTDLSVRSRIIQAKDNVTVCREAVSDVRAQLLVRQTEGQARLAAIGRERQERLTR